ncbi:hypothetical protein BJX65DRAFT_289308 [Aspergillus insuetus]
MCFRVHICSRIQESSDNFFLSASCCSELRGPWSRQTTFNATPVQKDSGGMSQFDNFGTRWNKAPGRVDVSSLRNRLLRSAKKIGLNRPVKAIAFMVFGIVLVKTARNQVM